MSERAVRPLAAWTGTRGGAPSTIAGGRLAGMVARFAGAVVLLVLLWWGATALLAPPAYVFPTPEAVWAAVLNQPGMLAWHTGVTALEIVLGLLVGTVAGVFTALVVAATPLTRRLVFPVVVITQTLPVFAIAPLLVIWLGFGLASKITMAALIIYFPIATAYAEAMGRADRQLMDLTRLAGAGWWQRLWLIRAPAGLPGLVAGLRIAATVAPIGAVVGEWVGASAGLGYLMLHANARLQTDVLFAALILLALLALTLRIVVDTLTERLVRWQPQE